MKNFLIIACLGYATILSAQVGDNSDTPTPVSAVTPTSTPASTAAVTIIVDTQQTPMSVLIPQATVRDVQKDWSRYVGMSSRGRTDLQGNQYTQYGAVVKNISPDPVNITSRLLGTPGGVRLDVWLSDNNNFESSHTVAADRKVALEKYLHDFAVIEYRQAVSAELRGEQSKQATLEKDLDKLIKEEERANKNISSNERSIQRQTDMMATDKSDMQSSTTQIEAQKAMVQTNAADANASKGAKKTLGDMEHDKKRIQRQSDNSSKDIDKGNKEIRADQLYIQDLKGQQVAKKKEIEAQKATVSSVQAKYTAIAQQ